MQTQNKYLRFCGIDVAKEKHMACIIDRDGQYLLRSQSFNNDHQGYQRILACLKKTGKTSSILVGMEATGHYWYSLHDFLIRQSYHVVVLNPIQTAQQAKKAIRKCKTDKHDAYHIAVVLRSGRYKAALVPSELAMTCRQLTRLRYNLVGQTSRIKQLIRSRMYPIWPEYEKIFNNMFCTTSMKLMRTAPSPKELMMLSYEELEALVCKTSRGQYGPKQAELIYQSAQTSVGMIRGLEGMRAGIQTLLYQIEALTPIRKQLENDIKHIADQLPRYLLTIPGADPILAVSLYGETNPIETFTSPSQLIAFAGLDPTVFQTGQYNAPRRHISKRGSSYLRDYWLKKRSQGKHYLVAVTAAANKLCHIVWRILTDRRDYVRYDDNPHS